MYAPEGTTIEIGAWQDSRRVTLQIRDEGPGIPAEDVERVFDKFYRADKADHVRAGTGLGLPISRGFIEIMGGTITAANRLDRSGALMTITLPAPAQNEALENAA
jgi:two-component system sensor histidine kinase KdpD